MGDDDGDEDQDQDLRNLVHLLETDLGYVNVELLGKGGMGCAFRVTRRDDRSRRACKLSLSQDLQHALETESDIMQALAHPKLGRDL